MYQLGGGGRSTLRYFLCVKTYPGHRLNQAEIRTVQDAAAARIGIPGLYRVQDGDVADIDAQSLEDELAVGNFSLMEFEQFCASSGFAVTDEIGGFTRAAAQAFLEHQWGQEVCTVELPMAEAAASAIYVALASFAREHGYRLWSPMPGAGDIDPAAPGRLPPLWHHYSAIEA
jgi:hypothetical protein